MKNLQIEELISELNTIQALLVLKDGVITGDGAKELNKGLYALAGAINNLTDQLEAQNKLQPGLQELAP